MLMLMRSHSASFYIRGNLVIMFYNSFNHDHALEPGTASADQLNLSDGGKNVVDFKDATFRGSTYAIYIMVDGKHSEGSQPRLF